jgi:hypothetical protein
MGKKSRRKDKEVAVLTVEIELPEENPGDIRRSVENRLGKDLVDQRISEMLHAERPEQ